MSYIRSKEIPPGSGNWYNYEVKGIREGSKVKQKVIRYIGRVEGDFVPATRTPITVIGEPDMPINDKSHILGMKTPASLIASALGMYYGGMSLDALQQQFKQDYDIDYSESNYWNWVKRFTEQAIRQAKHFKPENIGNVWIADETYMKLKGKVVYFWDIIDLKTNYLLASHVSTSRGASEARILMNRAKKRAGRFPKVVVTDKLKSYIQGVGDVYGSHTEHRQGGPFKLKDSGDSTAEIERFHRTLEQRTKVFQKYKNLDDIKLLTDGWLINYNFFKQNEGCGNIPPAQAASKVVPIKDWNDVVIPEDAPDVDYKVSLSKRSTVKKGAPVYDATLTPVKPFSADLSD